MEASAPRQTYSREEACRLLSLPPRSLKQWERQGLLPPSEQFSFSDLITLRTLSQLRADKVPAAQIRLALEALRTKLQHVKDPLTELKIVSDGRRVRVSVDGHTMEPVSGQLLLNFATDEIQRLLAFPHERRTAAERAQRRRDAETWFQKGAQLETELAPAAEVIAAYEKAAELDPQCASALVNLGTIHFNARRWREAERYYKRAVEADPKYPLAHFNLGNLYDERSNPTKALHHYEEALRLQPRYADAHYNLALLYQGTGQYLQAVGHWQTFLKLDPHSDWAEIARREVEKLRRMTVVNGAGPSRTPRPGS